MAKYLIQGHIKNESQISCYSHNHSELWFPFPSCQTDFSITACQTLQLIIHSSVSARQQHYSGAKHAKRVRACLEEWGKRNPGEANITNKKKHTNKQTNKQSKQRNITNKQKFVSPYGHNAALPKVSYYHCMSHPVSFDTIKRQTKQTYNICIKGEPKPRRAASSGLLPTISSFVIEQAKNPIEVIFEL